MHFDTYRSLEKIVGALLIENQVSLTYLMRFERLTPNMFELMLGRLFNSHLLTPNQQELLAMVAGGHKSINDISLSDIEYFISLGLLESDKSWNPFVWIYFALNSRCLISFGEQTDLDFQEWVYYHLTLLTD